MQGGFSIPVPGGTTTAREYPATPGARATLVLAHGAGAPQTHPWMVAIARAIAAAGFEVVTFNFLYMELRRGGPDRPPVLEQTWRAVLDAVRARARGRRVFIGGKSMGGRFASRIAASAEVEVGGVVLLGYPLHPPGKPEQLRTEHLAAVRAPMLFVQGTRDPFGSPDELRPFLEGLAPGTRLLEIEGGDHSLATPKKAGISLAQTMDRVAREIASFIG